MVLPGYEDLIHLSMATKGGCILSFEYFLGECNEIGKRFYFVYPMLCYATWRENCRRSTGNDSNRFAAFKHCIETSTATQFDFIYSANTDC